jgi:hypothetical protein
MLGKDWFRVHQSLVHTLGILTLTGYNPDMSNRAFSDKRNIYSTSNLMLNKSVAKFDNWDSTAILERCQILTTKLCEQWPSPNADTSSFTDRSLRDGARTREEFDVQELRRQSLSRISAHLKLKEDVIDQSLARYLTSDGKIGIVCLASRPDYLKASAVERYWFGFSPDQKAFLEQNGSGYLALACGSPERVLLVPLATVVPWLPSLHKTVGKHWHIQIDWGESGPLVDLPGRQQPHNLSSSLI